MKIAVQKIHLWGQIWYRSLDYAKKNLFLKIMSWTIERKLQEKLDVPLNVSKNLIRLLDKEENTPTFVARYRRTETADMTPEGVFAASKCIQELKEIQKKSTSILTHLEKANKLTQPIKKEIAQIDNLDEMNETIKLYKGTKSSALQKAVEQGAEQAWAQGQFHKGLSQICGL